MYDTSSRFPFTFPIDPNGEVLCRDWNLTNDDVVEIRRCRGDDKRLSFAIQLCVLRQYGRFLGDDYSVFPVGIANHLGRQLGIPPVLVVAPPSRAATDVEHERRIREYLGWRPYDDAEHATVEGWLREQAAEGLLAEELLVGVETLLRTKKVVAPARYRLERAIGTVTTRAEEETFTRISGRLSQTLRDAIDAMATPNGSHRSTFFQLKQFPPEPKSAALNTYLERADYLRSLDVAKIDFSGIRPEAVRHLAALALRYDVEDLGRFAPVKRHALVACFLAERNKVLIDHLVTMHHGFVATQHSHATRAFEKKCRSLRSRHGKSLRMVLDAIDLLLDPERSIAEVSTTLDFDSIRAASSACRELQTVTERGKLDALRARHHVLKRYLPSFLNLPFEASPGTEPLLKAIEYARKLHSGECELTKDAPRDFVTGFWKAHVPSDPEATPDLRTYDLALADAVREALRSGDLYLTDSLHHQSFWNLVQSEEEWGEKRDQAYVDMKLPTEADRAIESLRTAYDAAAVAFAKGFDLNKFVRVENNLLRVSRRKAVAEPAEVNDLRRIIEAHLPRIRIEDLLLEVDGWCGLTKKLEPPIGYAKRMETSYATLLAALVAHGTNLGISMMAQSTKGISVDMLQNASRWLLRPETLKAADTTLVDFHHGLELSSVWGNGMRSSSDGQVWRVQEGSLLAGFYPRYFGYYDRALCVYGHTSDQYSGFSSRAISCSPKEALYVLDGLLENDTVLQPTEHYTDTHGATEHLFGLCHLLGFDFMPRLKDPANVLLYKFEQDQAFGVIDPFFKGCTIDFDLIREQWDPLVRIAASLKNRTSPANVVLERLIASERSDRLSKALAALGRVVRTTFLMRYFHDAELRRRIHLQLNRGEYRHSLAKRLFFANQGAFRNGDYEEIMNKVSALSLLSNAVLVWNTVKFAEILKGLEQTTGKPVNLEHLVRVCPLLHEHVIPSGTYHFDRAFSLKTAS